MGVLRQHGNPMASANAPEISLRLETGAYKRLGLALLISAAIHLLIWPVPGLVSKGKLRWLTELIPTWLKPEKVLAENMKKQEKQKRDDQVPIVFVDVSPDQAVTEPPKKTIYYSDKSSKAANPDP